MRWPLFIAVVATSQAVFATAPPEIPPQPAELAAAKRLVAELRLSEQVENGFALKIVVIERTVKSAEMWFDATHPKQTSDVARRLFLLKTKEEAARTLPLVVPGVRDQLITNYAYHMKAVDLDATAQFFLLLRVRPTQIIHWGRTRS